MYSWRVLDGPTRSRCGLSGEKSLWDPAGWLKPPFRGRGPLPQPAPTGPGPRTSGDGSFEYAHHGGAAGAGDGQGGVEIRRVVDGEGVEALVQEVALSYSIAVILTQMMLTIIGTQQH